MFAGYDSDINWWMSWDYVKEFANILNVPTVPELWRGKIESEEQLKNLVEKFVNEPSLFGPQREGVVIRLTKTFSIVSIDSFFLLLFGVFITFTPLSQQMFKNC